MMFSLTFWKQIMYTATIVLVISAPAFASIGVPRIFNYVLEPVQAIKSAGMVELELVVYPYKDINPENKLTEITVTPLDDLQYSGEMTWSVKASKEDPYRTILTVVIPPNDTCGISIELRCGRFRRTFERHFVTEIDTVKFFRGNPRYNTELATQPRKGPRRGWHLPGQFPRDDSLYGLPIPPFEIGHKYETYILSKEEITRSKMRKLEREPLSGIGAQVFFIDGKVWMRKRGETKFYETEPVTETDEYAHLQTGSIGGIPGDAKKEVCLIISTQEQLEQAEKLLGTLEPTEEQGYYHQAVKWDDLKKLDSVGIKIIFIELVPHKHGQTNTQRVRTVLT